MDLTSRSGLALLEETILDTTDVCLGIAITKFPEDELGVRIYRNRNVLLQHLKLSLSKDIQNHLTSLQSVLYSG